MSNGSSFPDWVRPGPPTLPARARPEITWSIMHPVTPRADYAEAVVAAAAGYRVDSFEVCGAVHSSTGSLDGAIRFRDYPAAAAGIDHGAVTATIASLNATVAVFHRSGRPVYYWHREVMVPSAVVAAVAGLLDEQGEFDLLGTAYQDLLRAKIREFFEHVPGMDGLVLTVTESDYSVIHNSNPVRYPPSVVIERVVTTFAEELKARGKRFVLRSFGSIARDYTDILAGAARVDPKFAFEIETKITPYDFSPFLEWNPFLKKTGAFTMSAEYDSIGEFLGAGFLPAADPARVIEGVAYATRAGVDRHTIRVDRIGHATFGSTQGIHLLAYDRAIRDPQVDAESIWREWAAAHWPDCPAAMTAIMRRGIAMVKRTHFIDGHVIFHAFPIEPGLKWIKASGILALFQPGLSLASRQGMWGILPHQQTPPRAFILQEKDEAVRIADECLAALRDLAPLLPATEYQIARTAWFNATVVTRLIREWCRCLVAYFEDMAADRPQPAALRAALESARPVFERSSSSPLPADRPAAAAPGAGHEYDHTEDTRDSIEAAYTLPLWRIILALPDEYAAEWHERAAGRAVPRTTDLVVCGGIADDFRLQRYMHASHALLAHGRPVRIAGNRVFPNGFVECRLATPAGMPFRLVIHGDATKSAGFTLTLNGRTEEVCFAPDGTFARRFAPADAAPTLTVRIQKSGKHYPWLHRIALIADPA